MNTDSIEVRFRPAFEQERVALDLLRERDIKGVERNRLDRLAEIFERGLDHVLRKKGPATRKEIIALVADFIAHGPKAIFSAGAQRGGDFLLNQLRGRWAEDVVLSLSLEGLRLVRFGPSQAAMPGEESHLEIVRTFREIVLLEGKRPDLLLFDAATWGHLPAETRGRSQSWPDRRLGPEDHETVRQCLCGIEVKNSTWHYATRRAATGRFLSITVKDEELTDLSSWSERTGRPLLFMQVLFDELYCMSFSRMLEAIERGYVYEQSDYEFPRERTGKMTHKFHLRGELHLCSKVTFPSESEAVVRVLDSGSVIPYIVFKPALATDTNADVIRREITYHS